MTICERALEVSGVAVRYYEDGEDNGRALLLLHDPLADAWTNWRDAIPPLAQTFHVFAPDLPGYGGSAPLPEMSVSALLGWLQALLDTLQLRDAVMVATSTSAVLARLFAAAQPQYVPALILVNGGHIPNFPPQLRQAARLPGIGPLLISLYVRLIASGRTVDNMVYNKAILSEDFLHGVHASAPSMARLMRGLTLEPFPEQRTPPVPTMLLWGANDNTALVADAERLKKIIPGAGLQQIADCGHLPQLEATDAFVFQVAAFLERLSRPAAPTVRGVGLLHAN